MTTYFTYKTYHDDEEERLLDQLLKWVWRSVLAANINPVNIDNEFLEIKCVSEIRDKVSILKREQRFA